jgi:Domain of unknown function (DUF5666)
MIHPIAAPIRHLCVGTWAQLRTAGLGLLIALAACGGGGGGGGGIAGVGSGGTGSFSVGTVTGFGSVFVNGLRYDDSLASVSDEDGARSSADLKLGMIVKVQGSVSSGAAAASSIMFDSELLGPVSAFNSGGKAFTILGQKVLVDDSTVFDATLPLGIGSVKVGQVLEVHGFVNTATNELQATQVELKTSTKKYKITGIVNKLQTSAKTFQIDKELISYAGLSGSDIPANLADGLLLKVRLAPSGPTTTWTATRLTTVVNTSLKDQDEAEVEGLITSATAANQFTVGSVSVDARSASFPNGTISLVVGARVEAKGRVTNGVLLATQVTLENSGKQIDLRDIVSSIDKLAKTFVVRGVTVNYGGALFSNGSETNLDKNVFVEVRGQTSPNSAVVNATRIKF